MWHASPTWSVAEIVSEAERRLAEAGVESARLEAERLLSFTLGVSRHYLSLERDRRLTPDERLRFARLIGRRVNGEPLQYIEGSAAFRELILICDARALIPRPETEQLVEIVSRWARNRAGGTAPDGEDPALSDVLDIGTGSGAIALALLSERVAACAVGLDISADALALAQENRERAGVGDRLELIRCGADPYEVLAADRRFDAIVSNPPYVCEDEFAALPREVRDREPRAALTGGADGLDVIRLIARGAKRRLRPAGALFLEIGAGQGKAAAGLVSEAGPWRSVAVLQDLADRDRFVIAQL